VPSPPISNLPAWVGVGLAWQVRNVNAAPNSPADEARVSHLRKGELTAVIVGASKERSP
jgi:hypothetical protein